MAGKRKESNNNILYKTFWILALLIFTASCAPEPYEGSAHIPPFQGGPNPPEAVIITSPADPFASNFSPVVLEGACTGESSHTVALTGVDGASNIVQTGLAQCSPLTGTFSFALTAPGADGTYAYSLTQTRDSNGVASEAVLFHWTYDTTPPAIPAVDAAASPTSLFSQILSGTKEGDSSLFVDGIEVVPLSGATTWSHAVYFTDDGTATGTPADGTYNFGLTSRDAQGNESGAVVVSVVFDGTPPAAPVLNPVTTPTNIASQPLSGLVEAGALVLINGVDPGVVYDRSSTPNGWSYTVSLSEGSNALVLTALDSAGNETEPAEANTAVIVLDTVAPAAPVVDPVTSPTNIDTQTLSGTREDGATVLINGVQPGGISYPSATTWSYAASLNPGLNTYILTARDAAGNTSQVPNTVVIELDQSGPDTPVVDAYPAATAINPYTFTGGIVDDSALVLFDGVEPAGITYDRVANAWSVSYALTENQNTISVTARDASGNVSSGSATISINLDTTPPEDPAVNPVSSPTDQNGQLITGSMEAGALVTLAKSGGGTITATSTGATNWEAAVPLDNGDNTFDITATDAVGNTSGVVTVIINSTYVGPAAPTVDPVTTPTSQGTQVITGGKTADTSIWINGAQAVSNNSDTTWTVTVSLTAEGDNTFNITARDGALLESAPTAIVIVRDTAAPPAPSINPVSTPTNSTPQVISGGRESGATVLVNGSEPGTISYPTAISWSYAAPLSAGTNTFTLTARDAAGNETAPGDAAVATIELDQTNPPTPIVDAVTSPTNVDTQVITGGRQTGDTILFNGVEPAGITYPMATTWSVSYGLLEGVNTISVEARDQAGNISSGAAGVSIELDTEAPPAPTFNPVITPTSVTPQVISGGRESGATVLVNGSEPGAISYPTAITWSYAAPMSAGTNTFALTARDAAGNISLTSSDISIELDQSPPADPGVDPYPSLTNVSPLVLSGTREADSTIVWGAGGSEPPGMTYPTATTWSISLTLAEGPNDYDVVARDGAGNESAVVAVSIELDTIAPVAVSITNPGGNPVISATDSLLIEGGCESGATVHLEGASSQSVACLAGAYSFSVDKTVNGIFNFTLYQADAIGNFDMGTAVALQWEKRSAQVLVTPTALTVSETGANTGSFSLVLNSMPGGVPVPGVVIRVESLDATEVSLDAAGTVYSKDFTFRDDDWFNPRIVTVWGVDDSPLGDGNQTSMVSVTIVTADDTTGYGAVNPPDVSVTVLDTQAPGITLDRTNLVVGENLSTDSFTVVLNKAPDGDVVIDLVSLDTTEVSVASPLVFNAGNWNSPQTVTVTGVDDLQADGNQQVVIALSVNGGATTDTTGYAALNPPDVFVTCSDNDAPGLTLSSGDALITSEEGTQASFTVVLNTIPDGDVVITVQSNDVSEATAAPASLVFNASSWDAPQSVTLTGMDDLIADGSQTISISLVVDQVATTDSTGYDLVSQAVVSLTNRDDDAPGFTLIPAGGLVTTEAGGTPAFMVMLNTQPDGDVALDMVSSDTSEVTVFPGMVTFTTADWATPKTVVLTGVDDLMDDGNQSVMIALSVNGGSTTDTTGYAGLNPADVSVTNSDDDVAGVTVTPLGGLTTTEGGGVDTFTVVLNTEPDGDVVLILLSTDTAEVVPDKATLIFTPADWATVQTVTVTGVNDDLSDGPRAETIQVFTDTGLTLDTTGYDLVDPDDVSVTNIDDDAAGVLVSPVAGLVTSEDGTGAMVTVSLTTQPVGTVTIGLLSSNESEVVLDKSALVFDAVDWSTPQAVTLTGVDDGAAPDGNQPVTVFVTMVSAPSDADYAAIDPADVSVTNQDNDSIGISVTPVTGIYTTESAGSASFNVVLNSLPNGDVLIDVASQNTAEVTVDKTSLIFTPSDWQTSQKVTLTGVNDTVADGDIPVLIALAINVVGTTDTTGYGGLNPDDVTVFNLDNESPAEGSPAEPDDLTGTIPSEGSVGSDSSYYVVDGLVNGGNYNVSLSSVSEDLLLYVYADNTNLGTIATRPTGSELCWSDNFADARPEACVAMATATGQFVVVVDVAPGVTGGATYTVDVTAAPVSVGAPGSPVDITASLPDFLGGMSGGVNSYYMVTGLTALQTYRVQLGNLTANVDLDVYSDVNFTSLLCGTAQSSIAETCEATPPGTVLYIRVGNRSNPAATVASYYINIMDPLTDEGSPAAPVNLTGLLPYEGMVKTTASYYKVTGLIPNAAYLVELINMAGQGALEVYPDSTFGTPSCTSDQGGNWPESCAVTATPSGHLYFMGVPGGGFSTAGAAYRVQIK